MSEETEKFFEAWEKETKKQCYESPEENANKFTRRLYNSGVACGAHQAIQAFQEMMIGRQGKEAKPLKVRLYHGLDSLDPFEGHHFTPYHATILVGDESRYGQLSGWYGTHKQEAMVFIVGTEDKDD